MNCYLSTRKPEGPFFFAAAVRPAGLIASPFLARAMSYLLGAHARMAPVVVRRNPSTWIKLAHAAGSFSRLDLDPRDPV